MTTEINALIDWVRRNGLDIDRWRLEPGEFDGVRGLGTPCGAPDEYYAELKGAGAEAHPRLAKPLTLLKVPFHLILSSTYLLCACPGLACLSRQAYDLGMPFHAQDVQILFLIDQRRRYQSLVQAGQSTTETNQTEARKTEAEGDEAKFGAGNAHDSGHGKTLESALHDPSPINWMPYIASLPETYSTTLFWSSQDIVNIAPSVAISTYEYNQLALEGMKAIQRFRRLSGQFLRAAEALHKTLKNGSVGPDVAAIEVMCQLSPLFASVVRGEDGLTLDEFLWAFSVIGTRSVYLPSLSDPVSTNLFAPELNTMQFARDCWNVLSRTSLSESTTEASIVSSETKNQDPRTSLVTWAFASTAHGTGPQAPTSLSDFFALPEGDSELEAKSVAELCSAEGTPESTTQFRTKYIRAPGPQLRKETLRREGDCALVPYLDLFNHSDRAICEVRWKSLMESKQASKGKTGKADKHEKQDKQGKREKQDKKDGKASRHKGEGSRDLDRDGDIFVIPGTPHYELRLSEGSYFPRFSESELSQKDKVVKEILISYGKLSNLQLAMRYGFALSPNQNDSIDLDRGFVDWCLTTSVTPSESVATNHEESVEEISQAVYRKRALTLLEAKYNTPCQFHSKAVPLEDFHLELLRGCGLIGSVESNKGASARDEGADVSATDGVESAFKVFHISSRDGLPWDLLTYLKVRVLGKRQVFAAYFRANEPADPSATQKLSLTHVEPGLEPIYGLYTKGQLESTPPNQLPSPTRFPSIMRWARQILLEDGYLSDAHKSLQTRAIHRVIDHLQNQFGVQRAETIEEPSFSSYESFESFTSALVLASRQLIVSELKSCYTP